MAGSPFELFRRNQKQLLVLLTGMAMFAFIFLDSVSMRTGELPKSLNVILIAMICAAGMWFIGNPRGKGNELALYGALIGGVIAFFGLGTVGNQPVVVTSIGSFDRDDLQAIAVRRSRANQFIQLASKGTNSGFGGADDSSLLQRAILLKEARERGIQVSNEAVSKFISQVTGNKLAQADYRKVLRDLQLPEGELYDILKEELAARLAFEMDMPPIASSDRALPQTPLTYWKQYKMLQVRQSLDVAAVPVDAFVAKVPEPNDTELSTFFERYKSLRPNPQTGEPGFLIDRKANLGYVAADFEAFEKSVQEPTEEEVLAYYNANKQNYRVFDLPDDGVSESDTAAPASALEPVNTSTPVLTIPDDKPAATPSADPAAPAAAKPESPADKPESPATKSESPATPATPESTKPEPAKPEPAKPESEKSPESSSESPKPTTEANPPAAAAKPRRAMEIPVRLASFVQNETPENPAAPAAPAPATPSEKPAESTPAPAAPKLELPPSLELPPGVSGGMFGDFPPSPGEAPNMPEPKFRELDDGLKLEIREAIRNDRAFEAMGAAVDQAYEEMLKLSDLYLNASDVESQKTAAEDLTKKLKAYAAANNLIYAETGLMTREQLMSSVSETIGAATEPSSSPFERGDAVSQMAFANDTLFTPQRADSVLRDRRYAYWKLEDTPPRVPSLSEVKSEVAAAWKLAQARPLAEKRAKELAELAAKDNKPLTEVLAKQTITGADSSNPISVRETPRFSWMSTPRNLPFQFNQSFMPPPQQSQVDGVVQPGEEFMRTVFDELAPGETGVASNEPKSIYYVARVKERDTNPADDADNLGLKALQQQFLADGRTGFDQGPYMYLGYPALMELVNSWRQHYESQYRVQWEESATVQTESP